MKSIVIASALLLCTTPGFAGDVRSTLRQPVTATLTLPFATVLPGVPFDIEITLTNASRKPVKVGAIAYLVVTLPDGARVPGSRRDANRLQPYLSADDTFIELAPGETARRFVGWDSAAPPNWSATKDFSAPGSYDIAVDLEIGDHADDDDLSNYVGTLRTSAARLQRVLPLGDDEAIWKRMQEAAGGHWTDDGFTRLKEGKRLAGEIIELHPASSYYPYALLLHHFARNVQDIPRFLEAAERFADSAAHAYLLKAAGDAAYAETIHAALEKNDVRLSEFSTLAETYYQAALDTSQLSVRAGAETGLRRARADREKISKVH